jgi:hypothetical protein
MARWTFCVWPPARAIPPLVACKDARLAKILVFGFIWKRRQGRFGFLKLNKGNALMGLLGAFPSMGRMARKSSSPWLVPPEPFPLSDEPMLVDTAGGLFQDSRI